MIHARQRRGFFLHVAMAFVLLLALFVMFYFNFMQGQSQLARGMVAGEVAIQLAQAGVSAGIGYFGNTREPSRLYRLLVTAAPKDINGQSEELPLRDNDVVSRMMADYGGQATMKVELSLLNFQPFYKKTESESGIVYGQTEKFGTLKIVSTASYHGTRRRIVAFKLLKVVNAVPYVVSKFTLFCQERALTSPNQVVMKKVDLKTGEPDAKNAHGPIFLRHGPERKPEESGWVFLGGGDYRLNLTWGDKGWGEQFQLLRKPWEMIADPSITPPLPPNFQTLLLHRGFFTGIKADNDLFDRFDFERSPEPVSERASVLHLYGAPPEAAAVPEMDVSPTYILGQVYRRYLALRYVRKLDTRQVAYLPFATIGDFLLPPPAPWNSAPAFDVRGQVFSGNFVQYAQVMSQVVQEPFNRAADNLGEHQEVDPPVTMTGTKRVQHRIPAHKDFLYEPSLNNGEVSIRDAGDTRLFDGSLARLRMEDQFLRERAVFTMPAEKFPAFLASKKRRIPGILFFTGGDIDINADLELDSGGIIAASGSISISGRVTVKPYGRPLVLASQGGDIKLKGTPRVEASLVALNGTVRREPGAPLDVLGNVVASTLDLDRLTANCPAGKIAYDPRLDPTAPGGATYAVYMGPSRDHYLAAP